jgi:hypothetical protein
MYPGNLQINVIASSMKTVYDLSCDALTCHYLAYLIVTSPNLCRHMERGPPSCKCESVCEHMVHRAYYAAKNGN